MKAFSRYACGAVVCGSVAVFAGGCAKSPTQGSASTSRKFLIVQMTVRGQIQPRDAAIPYYYFCVINRTDRISEPGPVPVVDRPWGNGFAAAAPNASDDNQGFIGYVQYDRFGGQTGYRCFRVEGNAAEGRATLLGQPDGATTPQTGEKTLSFRFDLNRLKLTEDEVEKRYVQINLIATNSTPVGAEEAAKVWDALGDARTGSINSWITLDATQNIFRRNSDTNLEPANDVRDHLGPIVEDPNLDIVDWSIEIRSDD